MAGKSLEEASMAWQLYFLGWSRVQSWFSLAGIEQWSAMGTGGHGLNGTVILLFYDGEVIRWKCGDLGFIM